MVALYDVSLPGLLALAFAIGFGAGWWTAVGTAMLIVKFVMFGMSDRRDVSHSERMKNNYGYSLDSFIPVLQWPSMWRWPVWRKYIRKSEDVRESANTNQETSTQREM